MSSSRRRDAGQRFVRAAAHAPDGASTQPSDGATVGVEVVRELVVALRSGPRLLVASVDGAAYPPLQLLLRRLRDGARQPTGTARWVPEWGGAALSAIRLQADLSGGPPMSLRVRFPLPRCERTLGRFPDRVALTDVAGFAEMERTRALPCAVLLPLTARDVLAEHLLGRSAPA